MTCKHRFFRGRCVQCGVDAQREYPDVLCDRCQRWVAANWLVRHRKAGCRLGANVARITVVRVQAGGDHE